MDDVSDEAGASLSQSFGMDKADIFFGRTLKLTLGWKIRSHRSENGKKIMGEDPQSLENHGFPQISQLVLHSRSSVHNQPESWMWTLDFFAYICVSLISGYSTSLAHDPVAPAFSRNPQQPQLHIFAAIAENRHTADEEGQAHPPSPVTKLNSWRMYIDESNWDRAAHR